MHALSWASLALTSQVQSSFRSKPIDSSLHTGNKEERLHAARSSVGSAAAAGQCGGQANVAQNVKKLGVSK